MFVDPPGQEARDRNPLGDELAGPVERMRHTPVDGSVRRAPFSDALMPGGVTGFPHGCSLGPRVPGGACVAHDGAARSLPMMDDPK